MRRYFHGPKSLLFICALVCGSHIPAPQDATPPTVKLEDGAIQGIRFSAARNEVAFLGVPYAAPPLGDLRWKPPQAVVRWIGTRKATGFGAVCPQLPVGWLPYIAGNEDCLYLNVWTTQLSARAKLPVIVYFHGGSNTAGYSQMTPLGPPLSRMGVVVVSANYRLGPFGFFAHPALTAESEHHSSGNYGLLDQLKALEWVHENISHFGGDPSRVTVMGQSSGAVDICLLMTGPMAVGLFQRAILESGECQSTLNQDIRTRLAYNSISGTGEGTGQRLTNDLESVSGRDILQKLRRIPAEEILKVWSHDPQIDFEAIVDGWVVPEQPAMIFAAGKQAHIPVLAGSNADEATVFVHPGDPATVDEYKSYLMKDTGKYWDQEFQAYPAESDAEVPAQYLRLQSDSFAYGARSMARAMTRVSQKAYLYYFTYVETGKRAHLGAYHGEELQFLSDSFSADWEHNPDDEKLGKEMRAYWTEFAKAGNPNAAGLPEWRAYNPQSDQRLELGRAVRVRAAAPQLNILEHIMNQILAETLEGPQ